LFDLIKNMVIGSFMEPLARKVHAKFADERQADSTSKLEDINLSYDMQTIEVMKRVLKTDSNCIDVGCHQGSMLKEILSLAPKGSHFAFEPIPDMYQGLLESFGSIQGLSIFGCALSDATGSTSFQHVTSNPAYSGLRQRRYDRPNEQIQEIFVKTELLDDLIPSDVPIRYIKVDVEGAELQVFLGGIQTIKNNLPVIVFEHGLGAADHYGTTPESIFDLLSNQCGLRLFLMSSWLESNGTDSLTKGAFCDHFYRGNHFYFMAAV